MVRVSAILTIEGTVSTVSADGGVAMVGVWLAAVIALVNCGVGCPKTTEVGGVGVEVSAI